MIVQTACFGTMTAAVADRVPRAVARATSLTVTGAFLGALVGPVAFGAFLDAGGSYGWAWFIVCMVLVGAVVALRFAGWIAPPRRSETPGYDHDTPPDGSWIILDTATPAEVAEGMVAIRSDTYVTPAEVPCTPQEAAVAAERAATIDGYVDLCVRENVLDEIAEKYDLFARSIPDLLLVAVRGHCRRLRRSRRQRRAQFVRPAGSQYRNHPHGVRPHARVRCRVPDDNPP